MAGTVSLWRSLAIDNTIYTVLFNPLWRVMCNFCGLCEMLVVAFWNHYHGNITLCTINTSLNWMSLRIGTLSRWFSNTEKRFVAILIALILSESSFSRIQNFKVSFRVLPTELYSEDMSYFSYFPSTIKHFLQCSECSPWHELHMSQSPSPHHTSHSSVTRVTQPRSWEQSCRAHGVMRAIKMMLYYDASSVTRRTHNKNEGI